MATGKDNWFARQGMRLAALLLRRQGLSLSVILLFILLLVAGLANLRISGDYRAFFDADNPDLKAYDALEQTYAKLDTLALVVRAREGDLFTPARLEAARDLTNDLWQLPSAARVDSITNHQHSRAEADDLFVESLIPDNARIDPALAEQARTRALGEPMLQNFLVAPDGRTANFVVTLQPPPDDPDALSKSVTAARKLKTAFEEKHPDLQVALVGGAVLDTSLREVSEHDAAVLSPLMIGALFLGLWLFYRSAAASAISSIIVGLSVATTVGAMGWLGIPMMSATAAVPVIVLTISTASTIHMVATTRDLMTQGLSRRDAIIECYRMNFEPVFITTVTTLFGFLGLNFADAPPYRDVGNMATIGTALAYLLTLGLIPPLMDMLRITPARDNFANRLTRRIPVMIARYPLAIIVIFTAVTAITVTALPRLSINDKFVDYFAEGVPFREDATFVSKHLPGLYFLEFSVPSGEEGGVNDPAYLKKLESFADWLRAQPGVTHVAAMTDIMKRLNRNMHGDDPAYDRLPENRKEAAQYLLLYEMSLPFGRDLNNQIDLAKSASRVSVAMGDIPTAEMQALERRAEDWLKTHTGHSVEGTGLAIIFAHLTERTLNSMLTGTAVGFLMIAICLFVSLRSLPLGILSVVVNLVPIAIIFGLWSLFIGEIGLYAAAVTTIAQGIIVDFATHILSKYQRARAKGYDARDAIAKAYDVVGPALIASAVTLTLGFAALQFADFAINAQLGLMTAAIIAVAFLTDLVLLPALLVLVDRQPQKVPHAVPSPAE
ncbi:efflux RND transporter permease subunit [Govanella unica]|uniref:MMPL family transporter n=1 Tax=Govanella unica TaxID=2975056 RepID=A0A9X3TZL5_9PROT|nr:MMPL family transporter [Govania unica]MDA5194607.1 MMPL family transporter [Govania unica]